MKLPTSQGMSLIEILIGCTIIVTGILALSSTFSKYVKFALNNEGMIQAAYLAEEGVESVTFLRDKSWSAYIQPLSTTTTYYLAWDATALFWKATTTKQVIDTIFYRTLTMSDVKRDTNDDITTGTGTYDPNTKKITVSVAFKQSSATTTKTMSTYITNLNSN